MLRRATIAFFLLPTSTAWALDLDAYRLVDLTHPFNERTIYWPTATTKFELTRLAEGEQPGGYFYSSYTLCTPEHGGTHLHAPVHFSETGLPNHALPLENSDRSSGRHRCRREGSARSQLSAHGRGRARLRGRARDDRGGHDHLVAHGLERSLAERRRILGRRYAGRREPALVSERTERKRLRYWSSNEAPCYSASIRHRSTTAPRRTSPCTGWQRRATSAVSRTSRILGELPATGTTVLALPMKIEGGSGGPVRVVALVER